MIETKLKISELHPFHDHPYMVRDDEEMTAFVESVRENGILSPRIVLPDESGGYEVISGHRKLYAALKGGACGSSRAHLSSQP